MKPSVLILLSGLCLGTALVGWRLAADGVLPPAMAIHAALMIAAWGVMMPMGAIMARYFKVTPRQDFPTSLDNPFWWTWHRVLQYGGIAVSTLALGVILSETGGRFDTWHGRCGLFVMTIGWLQVGSALLRGTKGGPTDTRADAADPATWRGDHYDMTPRRLLFEAWHKRAGWAVLVLAAITILLGVDLAGSPAWLLGLVAVLQAAGVLAVLDGRCRHRWVDTYVALWGPGAAPSGNGRLSAAADRRPPPR